MDDHSVCIPVSRDYDHRRRLVLGDGGDAPTSPTPVITVHVDPEPSLCYEKDTITVVDDDEDYEEEEVQISPPSEDYDAENDFDTDADRQCVGPAEDYSENPDERLGFWQNKIRQNVRGSYYTVGQALYRVLHQERLLKTAHFIKWAHNCFGLTRSTAYEYIRAYRIVQLLQSQDPTLKIPSTLSHFRVFNKTKLKDGGAEVTRLWRTILSELPEDNSQKPRTAKEVLSKGKEIMEREKLGDHAPRMNGLLPGRSSDAAHGSRRQRAASAGHANVQYPQHVADDQPWGGMYEPAAKRRLAMGSLDSQAESQILHARGGPSDTSASGGHLVDRGFGRGHLPASSSQLHRPPALSGRWASASSNNSQQQQHQQPRATTAGTPTRRSQRIMSAEYIDESETEPPALIRIEDKRQEKEKNIILVPTLLSASRKVIRNGEFDLSLTPPHSPDEQAILEQCSSRFRSQTNGSASQSRSEKWAGRIWGNFTGPNAETHFQVTQAVNRAVEKFDCGEFDEAILVTNIAYSQDWFQKLLQYPQCLLKKYVETPVKPPQAAARDRGRRSEDYRLLRNNCAVFYLGPNVQKFVDHFHTFGNIPGMNTWCNYTNQSSAP